MALSQYVAINFLTKFDKKGLERATKELKGFDKVVATGSFRLRAFAKAGGVAAAAGLAIFTKRSISAALAQERLDKSLQLTLYCRLLPMLQKINLYRRFNNWLHKPVMFNHPRNY